MFEDGLQEFAPAVCDEKVKFGGNGCELNLRDKV